MENAKLLPHLKVVRLVAVGDSLAAERAAAVGGGGRGPRQDDQEGGGQGGQAPRQTPGARHGAGAGGDGRRLKI